MMSIVELKDNILIHWHQKVGVQEGSECVDTRGVSGVGVGSRGFIGDVGRRRQAGVVGSP